MFSLLAGMALWMAGFGVAGSTRLLANLLPGVGVYEPTGATARLLIIFVTAGVLYGYLLCLLQQYAAGERRHLPRRALHRLAATAGWLLSALGLRTLRPGKLMLQTGTGVAGGIAAVLLAVLLAGLLTRLGTWSTPIPGADPRDVIAAQAGTAAAAIHGFIAAAPSEELAYRGPLLFVAAALQPLRTQRPRLCRIATVTVLLATSYLFGTLHAQYGTLNTATATANGLIWGVLALRARSIVPAIVGHGLYNAAAFAGQTL